jgi:putative transposase
MSIRRSPHAVYDCQYHLVWCCKYRRTVIQGAVAARLRALLREIAEAHDIGIEEMEVASDHVHVFCNFPPRLSIVQVITRLKSLSARALFAEFPQIKKDLWGGELWAGSYS